MILLNNLLVISIIGITLLALYFLLREKLSFKKKMLLYILRIIISLLMIVAFIEPSFTISRYLTPSHTIGILIDGSQSMNLFRGDSVVNEFRKKIEDIEVAMKSKKRKTRWFLFGDSLRQLKEIENINFNDQQSFFPFNEMSTKLKEIDEFIIISDGNWTNQKIDLSQIQNKILWYIKLPTISPLPFISTEAPETLISYSDSIAEYSFICKGFVSEKTILYINLEKEDKNIFTDSILIPKGHFYFPYSIKIKSSKKGFNLYKVTIENRDNNLKSSNFFIHKVIPSFFRYSFYFDKQSIDMRFLKLALNRDKRFRELDSNSKLEPDVIFLFDPVTQINTNKVEKTLLVFMGCVPEKGVSIKVGKDQKLFLPDPTMVNPFFALGEKKLPPISNVIKSTSIEKIQTWISIVSSGDTIPLIFTGEYKNKKIIVCAFTDLWQWDFLPLSYSYGESDIFSFSNSFVNAVVLTLSSMQNDTFLLCPVGNLKEDKYIRCIYTLPYNNSSYVKRAIKFECYNKDNSTLIYDTIIEIENFSSLFNYSFLPPLDKGSYVIKAELISYDRSYKSYMSYKKSLEVLENNEEFSVMGQNEPLLKEIGKELDLKDTTTLNSLLRFYGKEILTTAVPYRFTIKRNWWLLLAILFVFALEWFLRKIWNLER